MTVTDLCATASPPEVPGHQVVLTGAGFGAAIRAGTGTTPSAPSCHKLYAKAKDKDKPWNASVDIDWSIEVDREDPGGLSEYLPVMAADAFESFTEAQKREAGHLFNTSLTSSSCTASRERCWPPRSSSPRSPT